MGKRKIMLLLMLLLFGFGNAIAQRVITGKVIDADGLPVLGATVGIKGTTAGTISGEDGTYRLKVPANVTGDTIVISFMGMRTFEEPINGRAVIDANLQSDDVAVDEVVVTAMGISRSEKTLGYAATKVDADDIVSANTTNLNNALAGKVAGVQINSSSSNPGAVSNMVIRGYSSINGSNQPLYVVDGVPMSNKSVSVQGLNLSTAGVSNISANDIESVSILKGAAATALYGSRAANGVVIITTKSGKKGNGKNFTVEYNGTVQARNVSFFPELQNSYGQGWNGRQTFIENGSWGAKFDGTDQLYGPVYDGKQLYHKYEALDNNVKDFLEIGWSQTHEVAFNGTSEDNKLNYYLSYSYAGDNGIMPGDNDLYKRNTISARTSYNAADWLKISSSINFARSETNGVGSAQGATAIDGLFELPRDVSIVDMEDLSNTFNTPTAYFTPYGITNPYWALENNYINIAGKEVSGKIQADFKPLNFLTVTYRFGFNYFDNNAKSGTPKIDVKTDLMWNDNGYSPTNMNQAGSVNASFSRGYEYNHDIFATVHRAFLDDKLDFDVVAGVQVNDIASKSMSGTTKNLSIETNFWSLSNGAEKTTLSDGSSEERLIGVYAQATLGWNDLVYLSYSARNDWSSTLPIDANSYFYNGVTGSFLFSKLLPENNILNFGKVRLSYGETGNAASPYMTKDVFTQAYANAVYASKVTNFPFNGVNAYQKTTAARNPELKPEMTHEIEAGLDLRFLNNRIGVDFSIYKKTTDDQIFTLPVEPANGFSSKYVNFGKVENQGIELLITTTPLKINDFRWDLNFNFAKNKNKVISLPKELEGGKVVLYDFGAGDDAVYMYAEEGEELGIFYTYLPSYDPNGNIIVGSNGQVIKSEKPENTGKSIMPDWTGGVSTTLSWKGLALGATLDVRKGGYMFSRTKNLMFFTGNGAATEYNDRNPFVIPNSVVATKDANGNVSYVPNTVPVSMTDGTIQNYYDDGGIYSGENYLVDRSFVKLRSVNLSYTLPKAWVNKVKLTDVTVGLFCNNVFTWTASDNRYIDPENTTVSQALYGDLAVQFGETYCNPSCRTWGFSLGVKF